MFAAAPEDAQRGKPGAGGAGRGRTARRFTRIARVACSFRHRQALFGVVTSFKLRWGPHTDDGPKRSQTVNDGAGNRGRGGWPEVVK